MRKITGRLLQPEQTLFTIRTKSSKNWWKGERRVCGERWACIMDCSLFEERQILRLIHCDQWAARVESQVANKRADKSQSQFGYGPCYSPIWILTLPGLRLFLLLPRPIVCYLCYPPPIWDQFIESKEAKIDLKLQHQSYCLFMDPSVVQSFLI